MAAKAEVAVGLAATRVAVGISNTTTDLEGCLPRPECLAGLAAEAGNDPEAARLFGAAAAIRQRSGEVRFKIYQAGYEAALATLRDAIGEEDFDCAWAGQAELLARAA